MEGFKNILVYINPEHEKLPALSRALELAGTNKAAVKVVTAIPEVPWYAKLIKKFDLREKVAAALEEKVEERIAEFDTKKLKAESKILDGDPVVAVIKEVVEGKHDLVMKTAEGSAIGRTLFGTTALGLLRKCPSPVWVLKSDVSPSCKCIIAAIDFDPELKECGDLNCRIMDLAVSFAKKDKADLHVIHVLNAPFDRALRRYVPEEEFAHYKQVREEVVEKELKEFLKSYKDTVREENTHIVLGVPATQIVSHANKLNVELVVMGTVARSGVAGFFMGNTAEQVLDSVDCSVLALKPDGFVSPVNV
ncbi:MAG: universal stress protein [Planctomycetota bacterium]|jgi:nucleotide-binding universal stress UspA family protein